MVIATVDAPVNGVVKIALRGTLSASSVPTVRHVIQKSLLDEPVAVVVDIGDLTIRDRSLLTVFPAALLSQESREAVILLVAAQPYLHTWMSRAVLGQVPIFWSIADAFDAAMSSPGLLRIRLMLGPVLTAARRARVAVAAACHEWCIDHVVDSAVLVVSELVTNAVTHAGTDMYVTAALRGPRLYLSVRDYSHQAPATPTDTVGHEAAGGRGLALVNAHCVGWGSTAEPDGKVVWAAIRVRPIEHDLRYRTARPA